MSMPSPLELALLAVAILIVTALIAPFLSGRQSTLVSLTFLLSSIASVSAIAAGILSVSGGATEAVIMPIGLADLPFHIRIDPLSGFFITVVGVIGLSASIYSLGYVRGFLPERPVTTLAVFYALFLAGMLLVLISSDAYFFMISWEVMAVSSYFLVTFEDERSENRSAAFIYLLIAHIGALFILLAFGICAGSVAGMGSFGGYTFSAMRAAHITPMWASIAFLLAFFGFAAKAGMVPLHVWLPEAHPAAPSNVSALMSAVMLKVALYGILRFSFDILHASVWWWGGIIVVFGLVSALMGILYALMQVDIKRVLAYSSVENVGIILIAIGLGMIFISFKMNVLGALALTAACYHILNHAMFKGLLFMGAGSILHATGERNMEKMGGLIHKMPWTSGLFLVGCLSIAALPPFNGFVSEWLLFQTFLLSPVLPSKLLNFLIPLGAALLALTAALAARCFVKVFGIVFLGHGRGKAAEGVHESGWAMRIGMILPAVACLLLGVLPMTVIGWLDSVSQMLSGAKLGTTALAHGWFWLTPVSADRASYSAPVVFIGVIVFVASAYLIFHARKTGVRRAPIWDCGFGKLTNRMQYTSTAFAMPLRRVFGSLLVIRETLRPGGKAGQSPYFQDSWLYHLKVRDRFWYIFYAPVSVVSLWIAGKTAMLQKGRIQIYLLYSFITLILLLVFA